VVSRADTRPRGEPIEGSFAPENLVVTEFDDPEAASWALFNQASPGFDASQLEGTKVEVMINGVLYSTMTGEDAIGQIGQCGGILIDYDEGQFQTETLSVGMKVIDGQGRIIYEQPLGSLPHWVHTGLLQSPQDKDTGLPILADPNVIVHELDDIDRSVEGLLSSLTPKLFGPAHVDGYGKHISGFKYGETEANAFDFAYRYVNDPTRTFLSFPRDSEVLYFNYWPLQEDPSKAESVVGILLGANTLVEFQGEHVVAPLFCNIGHQKVSQQDTPYVYAQGRSLTLIPAGTVFGVMEKGDGNPGGLNYGIVADYCFGASECDPANPGDDPHGLVLPIAIFFSQQDKDLALEAFYRGDPVEIPRE